ncbi:MAG: hypothetical protein V1748_07645, partial [Actinomycetota bacterium]
GNLLNKTTGLNPNVIIQAIAGPTNSGEINPRTGTPFAPGQSVLRRLWGYGATVITGVEGIPPWWPIPELPTEGWVQIMDAQLNTSQGDPHWVPQPW